jgi:2-methylisocitrate lyase-like PEP mutase family enzyme
MTDGSDRRDFLKSATALAAAIAAAPAGVDPPHRPATQAPTKAARLRRLLEGPPFHAPVIETVLQARLAEQEGFQFLCVSGQAPSRALGIPDVGLVTLSDLLTVAAPIAANTEIPVLCDMEDGKGTAMHVYRGIQLYERAGIVGALIEDASLVPHMGAPKGDVIPLQQMVDKIHAAADARRDQSFLLLIASVGLREGRPKNEVMDRAAAYAEAGADAFWFPGLPLADNAQASLVVKRPIMSTTGTVDQMKEAKVAFAAILDFGMISLGAVRRALQELKATGAVTNATKEAMPFEVLRELDHTAEVRSRAQKYHVN